MGKRLDTALTVLLTLAAITMAGTLVKREFFPQPQPALPEAKPKFTAGWQEFALKGRVLGDSAARVKVVEFADLQCPFCSTFHKSLEAARAKFARDLAVVFVHLPSPGHKYSEPAARALECVDGNPMFERMLHLMFAAQDSFGVPPWSSFARDAGVSDTAAFNECMARAERPASIDSGLVLGGRLGVHATPTIYINGWRYIGGLDEKRLTRAVQNLLAGKSPE